MPRSSHRKTPTRQRQLPAIRPASALFVVPWRMLRCVGELCVGPTREEDHHD